MSASLVFIGICLWFFIGYRFYSRFIEKKLLHKLDLNQPTPAQKFNDNIDFVPTPKNILFGHHFSSIAGAAPIVGPAVAVIWGWVPAMIWIALGVVFMGATHDFSALVISLRHKGESLGEVVENLMGKKVKVLLLSVIFFLVWMVIAVFALVIANLFISFPSSVLPVNFEIIIAVLIGLLIKKTKIPLKPMAILAQIGLFLMIYLGTQLPMSLESFFGDNQILAWIILLLIYSFVASTLPVWLLLQPRDYINSHQLFLGMGLLIVGLLVSNPTIVAPAINFQADGAPPWFPFLFITIACGAISGFHGLVSSSTTAKQIRHWKDARSIGYGSMLGEGLLATLATLAICAGFETSLDWHNHYASWSQASSLADRIGAFVMGSSKLLENLMIPSEISQTILSVLIISFAATSLDTSARIQRYVITELGETMNISFLKNRYIAAAIAISSALILVFMKKGGTGGLLIWPLFGATNQMLAGLTLVIISVYIKIKLELSSKAFIIPAIIVTCLTIMALGYNIWSFTNQGLWMLVGVGSILFILQMMITYYCFRCFFRK